MLNSPYRRHGQRRDGRVHAAGGARRVVLSSLVRRGTDSLQSRLKDTAILNLEMTFFRIP